MKQGRIPNNTQTRQPCLQLDSAPQFQQASESTFTPYRTPRGNWHQQMQLTAVEFPVHIHCDIVGTDKHMCLKEHEIPRKINYYLTYDEIGMGVKLGC
jgi:hypothetical protein